MKGFRFHEWINSIGALLALVISAISAYISWTANTYKIENLKISARKDEDCPASFDATSWAFYKTGEVALCWRVTITNNSELKSSVVSVAMAGTRKESGITQGDAESFLSLFSDNDQLVSWNKKKLDSMLNSDGQEIMLPLTIDGGESKAFTVRCGVFTSEDVIPLLLSIDSKTGHHSEQWNLRNLEVELAKNGKDILGNKVRLETFNGRNTGISVDENQESIANASCIFKISTGKGNKYEINLSW